MKFIMNDRDNIEISLPYILKELENIHYPCGVHFQRLQRYKALFHKQNNNLEAVYNIVQSHTPGLRNKALLRYEKCLSADEDLGTIPLIPTKDVIAMQCSTKGDQSYVEDMLKQIEQMPKEWTLIHLTPQFNPMESINEDNNIYYTNAIHIAIFNCGQNEQAPILVSADAPRDCVNGDNIELVEEMMSIITENKETLMSYKHKNFRNLDEKSNYFNNRDSIEQRLKVIINDIQDLWLREWKCLFSGKYTDAALEEKIKQELINTFNLEFTELEVTMEIICILTYVVKGTAYLKITEIRRTVQHCFPEIEDKHLLRRITQCIRNLGDRLISDAKVKKHPVILVLDDSLDFFPWEMIDILDDQQVSRVPSLQFIYSLFKEHEKDITRGCKVLSQYNNGRYVVNPDGDLKKMQNRMTNFFKYWTPNWVGTTGYQLNSEEFLQLLTSAAIFSYNGHGSGSHLLPVDKIQRTHVKAVVLLFGCGSTKINRIDPQVEMYGPYHMYVIARCPCMVGMLWEVTDLDTDILTTNFMSAWIPSEANVHWKYIDKNKWYNGQENVQFVGSKIGDSEETSQRELLQALNSSKKVATYYVTKSACVARGLPVIIQENGVKI